VIHHAQRVVGFDDDAVAGTALHVGHETDTAAFLFIGRIVQAVGLRQSARGVGIVIGHRVSPTAFALL
jgi:hypothetical protein